MKILISSSSNQAIVQELEDIYRVLYKDEEESADFGAATEWWKSLNPKALKSELDDARKKLKDHRKSQSSTSKDKDALIQAAQTYSREASDRASKYTEKYLNIKDAGTIQRYIAKKIRNGDYGLLAWTDEKDAKQVNANWSKIQADERALIIQAKGANGTFKIPIGTKVTK